MIKVYSKEPLILSLNAVATSKAVVVQVTNIFGIRNFHYHFGIFATTSKFELFVLEFTAPKKKFYSTVTFICRIPVN